MEENFANDIRIVQAIDAVPSILEVLCRTTGMGFAAVARVTEDRWIACGVRDEIDFGLEPGGELEIETTICQEIRAHREPVVIDDVASDPYYCTHHTPKLYGLKSYISVPVLLPDGTFFGTLCAISPEPAQVSQPHILPMFRLFADMIGSHIKAQQSVEQSKVALLDEQETSALREQFIAVLGHDLRNPLGGIMGGVRMLRQEALSSQGAEVLALVESTVDRMAGLIDNVMDFARGRLGGGITLEHSPGKISEILEQVVSELRSSHPDRDIRTDIRTVAEIEGDHVRLGQLFSNLLGNAIKHGHKETPVSVVLTVDGDMLDFRTINAGEPIAPDAMERLFAPFSRGEVEPNLQGLGLGLYISSQIAQAHNGTLTASSDSGETVFTFRMPISVQ
jgi:signal transduction histidine kinase